MVTLKTELVDATDNVIDAATGTLTLTVEDTDANGSDLVSLQQTVWVTLQALTTDKDVQQRRRYMWTKPTYETIRLGFELMYVKSI